MPGLIPRLNAMGIVCAMGHSGAGYDQCAACVDAGVRSVTHLGNAMRLFHQHDPAIFGVALERDVYVEAICDGRHLHPGTVRLYLKAKGYDRGRKPSPTPSWPPACPTAVTSWESTT